MIDTNFRIGSEQINKNLRKKLKEEFGDNVKIMDDPNKGMENIAYYNNKNFYQIQNNTINEILRKNNGVENVEDFKKLYCDWVCNRFINELKQRTDKFEIWINNESKIYVDEETVKKDPQMVEYIPVDINSLNKI